MEDLQIECAERQDDFVIFRAYAKDIQIKLNVNRGNVVICHKSDAVKLRDWLNKFIERQS